MEKEEDSDMDSDLELSHVKNLMQHKKSPKHLKMNTVLINSYTSIIIKEEPIEDISNIFIENNLEIEKQKFHQQIVEKIVSNLEKIELHELQDLYLAQFQQVASLEIFNCLFCSYQTISESTLKSHLLVTHGKRLQHHIYQCERCNFDNIDPDKVSLHLQTHIGQPKKQSKKSFKKIIQDTKCDLCPFEAKPGNSLRTHKSTHRLPPKQYKCHMCDFANRKKITLAKHLLQVHQIENDYYAKNAKKYKCPSCEYITDEKSQLKTHSIVHKNPEEIEHFYCSSCPFKTKFKKSLENHQLTHDPSKRIKTHMCEICSYKCCKPSDLRKHLLTHKSLSELSESEIFSCPECPYRSKKKDNLKEHLLIHGPPQFTCDICGYQGKRKQNYQHHMKLHKKSTELTIYQCQYCPYKSRHKGNYNHHMKMGDHSGKNLKHIPHRFRVENTDRPDFDQRAVRFGPPKKYKYPKNKEAAEQVTEHPSGSTHEEVFLNFMATNNKGLTESIPHS